MGAIRSIVTKVSLVGVVAASAVFLLTACGGDEGCTPNCEGKQCGDDGCGGVCGTCGEGLTCQDGQCVAEDPCAAACAGKECGNGGVEGCVCGPANGACEEGKICNEEFMCVVDPCIAACEGKCGKLDVDHVSCDCGDCEGNYACEDNVCVCQPKCVGDDGVKFQCGDDGCGKTCGTCKYGECVDHFCHCTPACENKECGPDGCGGTCGECGGDTPICAKDMKCYAPCPEPESFSDLVQKVVHLARGVGGYPGEALDVDLDPDTCAPEGQCEGGLNNGFSKLLDKIGGFTDINAELAKALDDGDITVLAEFIGYNTEGTPFTINMYTGEPAVPKEVCDFQAEKCTYFVKPESYDPSADCTPLISFDNAKVVDEILTAGGPDAVFVLSIPIPDIAVLTVTINMAQIYGRVTGEGDDMSITEGLIGGALRKDKLLEAVDLIPEDAGLPVSKEMIKNILDMTVEPDLDSDGDGELDAASLAFKFETIAGSIAGYAPTEKECSAACEGKECGDGGVLGCNCGVCEQGKTCVDGVCQ